MNELEIRKIALETINRLVEADEDPFSICPGCIIDRAIMYEEYLTKGTNSAHKHEDSNLTLVED